MKKLISILLIVSYFIVSFWNSVSATTQYEKYNQKVTWLFTNLEKQMSDKWFTEAQKISKYKVILEKINLLKDLYIKKNKFTGWNKILIELVISNLNEKLNWETEVIKDIFNIDETTNINNSGSNTESSSTWSDCAVSPSSSSTTTSAWLWEIFSDINNPANDVVYKFAEALSPLWLQNWYFYNYNISKWPQCEKITWDLNKQLTNWNIAFSSNKYLRISNWELWKHVNIWTTLAFDSEKDKDKVIQFKYDNIQECEYLDFQRRCYFSAILLDSAKNPMCNIVVYISWDKRFGPPPLYYWARMWMYMDNTKNNVWECPHWTNIKDFKFIRFSFWIDNYLWKAMSFDVTQFRYMNSQ